MKLPGNIKGRHKIRDGAIMLSWYRDLLKPEQIAEKFNLTERRIQQIVRLNSPFLELDEKFEKVERIRRLKIEIKGKNKSNKDVADLLEQLRKEIEGDKPLVDQSKHTHYTVIWEIDGNKIPATRKSGNNLAESRKV